MKNISNVQTLGQCTMVFAGEERIETAELADFLFLFRGVYAAGIQVVDSLSRPENEPAELSRLVRKHLRGLKASEIDDLFRHDLGANRLLTEHIARESPIELVIIGLIVVSLAAVIISGGTFELVPLKVHLPPIAETIISLREALASGTRAPLGYGVKSRTVILSRGELAVLMLQDPRKRRRGGFQRFLVGLQMRVNRKTRELELSEEDIDFILKYLKDRSVGGFQGRIHKIFSRHFGFSEQR
jgi:hypothetical protein